MLAVTQEGYTTDADYAPSSSNSDPVLLEGKNIWEQAFNTLAIYGQYRNIDAQYDQPPPPDTGYDIEQVNYGMGNQNAGSIPVISPTTKNLFIAGIALIGVGAITYMVVK